MDFVSLAFNNSLVFTLVITILSAIGLVILCKRLTTLPDEYAVPPQIKKMSVPANISKQGFSKKKLAAVISGKPLDVIVIGSGVGGLTCAYFCRSSRE